MKKKNKKRSAAIKGCGFRLNNKSTADNYLEVEEISIRKSLKPHICSKKVFGRVNCVRCANCPYMKKKNFT